jgi:ferredoxin
MADLCYRQGKFSEAAQQAQMAAETSCAGAGMCSDPVGILAQLRLGQLGPARQQAGELAKGPDAALVQEIVAAQNLIETLQRNGYAP